MPIGAPTPIPITSRTRNLLLLGALALVVLLCWRVPTVPQLVLTGAALALILSFPVRLLSRILPRGLAIALVMLLLVTAAAVAALVLVPLAAAQLTSLVQAAPSYARVGDDLLRQVVDLLAERGLLEDSPEQTIQQVQQQAIGQAQSIGQEVLARLLDALTGVFGILLTLFGVVFVAVYLLADSARFKVGFMRALPVVYRDDAEDLWNDAGESLSRYLGGLLISLSFQGIASTAILFALGVPYSLLLGIWTAIGAIVPYVGSYIGAVPAIIAALFVSPLAAVLTGVGYFAINQIDGNLITPRVQGQAIRVHPLLIFMAVIVGGQLAGLWGALLAVPLLAVLRVVFDFLDQRLVVEDDARRRVLAVAAPAPGAIAAPESAPMPVPGADEGAAPVG
jgi:predicted PurR-regulated permease PerM